MEFEWHREKMASEKIGKKTVKAMTTFKWSSIEDRRVGVCKDCTAWMVGWLVDWLIGWLFSRIRDTHSGRLNSSTAVLLKWSVHTKKISFSNVYLAWFDRSALFLSLIAMRRWQNNHIFQHTFVIWSRTHSSESWQSHNIGRVYNFEMKSFWQSWN